MAGMLLGRQHLDDVIKAMQTRAAADAMAYDGVLPEPPVMLIES
jgi:Mg/Co/Ni transporter MgtE